MPQPAKKKRLFVHAVANRLGYDVPDPPPRRSDPIEVRERAQQGVRTFSMAVSRGTVPKPDGRSGRKHWWYESTIDRYLANQETKAKRGRPTKAEVTDAA